MGFVVAVAGAVTGMMVFGSVTDVAIATLPVDGAITRDALLLPVGITLVRICSTPLPVGSTLVGICSTPLLAGGESIRGGCQVKFVILIKSGRDYWFV